MVIQVKCISSAISPQLLDEFPSHTGTEDVSTIPMSATMWCEMVFQPLGAGIMQAGPPGSLYHKVRDSGPVKPLSLGI
jgi:hypothetical protein